MVTIGHFAVVYLVGKPMTWSEAEGDHIEIETRQSNLHLKSSNICILTRSTSVLLLFKGLATKHSNRAWGIEPQTCDALPLSHKDSTVSKVLRIFGKVSAQPHTIVKQICFPNGNVLFLSLFSLFKNWMHNVGWGCTEILPNFFFVSCSWKDEKYLSLVHYRAQNLPSLLFY